MQQAANKELFYCLKCHKELDEVQPHWGVAPFTFYYCTDSKCIAYGVFTVGVVTKENIPEEL